MGKTTRQYWNGVWPPKLGDELEYLGEGTSYRACKVFRVAVRDQILLEFSDNDWTYIDRPLSIRPIERNLEAERYAAEVADLKAAMRELLMVMPCFPTAGDEVVGLRTRYLKAIHDAKVLLVAK